MDAKQFMEALGELEVQKGISKESIIEALKEALRKAYAKSLGGGDDADIRVEITDESIKMELVKKVVEDVQDDYLEISVEDANKGSKKKYAAGDEFKTEVSVDELARFTALVVKSVLRQKLAEAEKLALYEAHKDKAGEMITGTVEKCDDKGAMVNIGRTSLFLSRKELIGDETFETGAQIRMYVSKVDNKEKGQMIRVSRSDSGFLKKLFEEEVRDIYDGTVIIHEIARDAGIRSKVSVYSNDPNVDCVGACIGANGACIQRILGNLGNTKEKEKIDIINYSKNDGLYIIDALRPATVKFISYDKEDPAYKTAVAIVPDGQLSLAIGKRGANARLACKLTGYNIDIKEEHEMEEVADDLSITFTSVEQLQEEEKNRIKLENYNAYISKVKQQRAQESAQTTTQGIEKSKPQQIVDEVEEVKPTVKEEPKAVEAKVEEAPVATPIADQPKVVKTTTTLESLEKSLEQEKKKEPFKAHQKTSKRPRNIDEDEVANEAKVTVTPVEKKQPQMDIYTKEELEEIENEDLYNENEDYVDDEEVDYDEFDSYYDEDNK